MEAGLTDLAVLAGVAVWTGAVVLVGLGVHAGSSVPAGPVGATVVEICGEQTPFVGRRRLSA